MMATRKSKGEAVDSHCLWTIHSGPFVGVSRIDGRSFRDRFRADDAHSWDSLQENGAKEVCRKSCP
jgi:hypothetical protein